MNFEKLILDLPRDQQEKHLRDSLKEKKIDVFIMLSKVLLNTPESYGGMKPWDMDKIFKEEIERGV